MTDNVILILKGIEVALSLRFISLVARASSQSLATSIPLTLHLGCGSRHMQEQAERPAGMQAFRQGVLPVLARGFEINKITVPETPVVSKTVIKVRDQGFEPWTP